MDAEYERQLDDKHLPYILLKKVCTHINADLLGGGLISVAEADEQFQQRDAIVDHIVEKLTTEQECRCHYSNIPMDWKLDSHLRFTCTKVDESLPFFDKNGEVNNIVLVCRLFTIMPFKMSRARLLEMFLGQSIVPLPEDVRTKAELELAAKKE